MDEAEVARARQEIVAARTRTDLVAQEMLARPAQASYGAEIDGEVKAFPSDEYLNDKVTVATLSGNVWGSLEGINRALSRIEDEILTLAVDEADSFEVNKAINEIIDSFRNGLRGLQLSLGLRS